MTRRSKGEGALFWDGAKGLWTARISLPDGRRKTKASKRQQVVKDWLLTARGQLRDGVLPKDDTTTVSQFFTHYLDTVAKHNLKPKTLESYSSLLNIHIIPGIGKVKLKDLRPDHLQALYSKKLESGLSRRTVHYIHSIIHKFLDQALRWDMIIRNVSDLVDAPTPLRRKLTVWNRQEVNRFLESTRGSRFWIVYMLCIYGGFREGEVLGIHKGDVDLARGAVTVNNTVQYLLGRGVVIGSPKTNSSRRAVKLPPTVMVPLMKHIEGMEDNQKLLFVTASGKPINPRFLIKHFKADTASAGLPEIRLHDLRVTMGTLALSAGIHPKAVQERLGHSSINLTLTTYSSVLPDIQDEAADKLDKYLAQP
jgi:integrase